MSIRINQNKCIGCKRCCDSCPGTLIDIQNNKACMLYPKDCWGCASCVKECPVGAIDFFLGADIGGNGSTMHVEGKGDILNWQITKSDGTKKIITINRKDSNKY